MTIFACSFFSLLYYKGSYKSVTILVYYSIRDHTNENISSVNLLTIIIKDSKKYLMLRIGILYISILMLRISLGLAK